MNRLSIIGLRVALAVALSFALWSFVSFSENPDEQATFEGLSVTPRGLDPGLVLVDQNSLPNPALPNVDVTVITDRRQRNQLRSVDLRTFVDLSDFGPGDYSVPVGVEVTRLDLSVSIPANGIDPRTIPIRLEALITTTAPITLALQGNVPFSFELGTPEIRQAARPIEQVIVQGPESRVQRVVAARAIANIDQVRASYSAPLQLQPIDAKGQVVEGVTLDPAIVNVTIPIRPVVGLRLAPIKATIVGLPAPGFGIVAVEVSPQLITLTGNSGALDRLEAIATETIDVSGARTSLEREVNLIFPPGTSAGPNETGRATVTVRIAALSQPFQVILPVQVNLVGVNAGLLSSLQPTVVNVVLSGSGTALGLLGAQPLAAEIDASGLGPGSYNLAPRLDLPQGVSLIGDPPQVTLTLRPVPTPEPTATLIQEESPTPAGEQSPAVPPEPTTEPPVEPTAEPTAEPTGEPTTEPTAEPTATP